jgi:hypothetical protein
MYSREFVGISALLCCSVAGMAWALTHSPKPRGLSAAGAASAHSHLSSHGGGPDREQFGAEPGTEDDHSHDGMPAALAGGGSPEAERALYLTPHGRYTAADIRANGPLLPSQKFRGVFASHNLHPAAGARLCPITGTLASPKFSWIVGGRKYLFCCPPCIDEFVRRAKEKPASIRPPEAYIKR